jgi:enamine deaminase RidA (YjgF/YER057c/UK114 family)
MILPRSGIVYLLLDVFINQDLKIYVKFSNAAKVLKIIGIVERLRLRSSNRLTVNVIRNQQRNRRTLDETNIASSQAMEYDSSPFAGLRQGLTRKKEVQMNIEAKIEKLGLQLPSPAKPVANYVPAVRTGSLVFLSGHGPMREDGSLITGKLGSDLKVEEGYEAAKRVALGILGSIKGLIGDLDKVTRIVKLLGMVNCESTFKDHPQVINGASDFLVEVFGDKGKHARSAVGMNALPFNISVEIEMVVEVED